MITSACGARSSEEIDNVGRSTPSTEVGGPAQVPGSDLDEASLESLVRSSLEARERLTQAECQCLSELGLHSEADCQGSCSTHDETTVECQTDVYAAEAAALDYLPCYIALLDEATACFESVAGCGRSEFEACADSISRSVAANMCPMLERDTLSRASECCRL